MLALAVLAGIALLTVDTQKRCPVTGSPLTAAQLADPALRVGGVTVCCKDCVTKYAARLRASSTARAGRDAYENPGHDGGDVASHSLGGYII